MTNLKQFLTKEKRFNLLLYLYNKEQDVWSSKAAREVNISRIYIDKVATELESLGFIEKEDAEGTSKQVINLTEDGEDLARSIERFDCELEEVQTDE